MNFFRRLLVPGLIGFMVLGMVDLAMASSLSRGNIGVEFPGVKTDPKNQKKVDSSHRVVGAGGGGCSNHLTQGADLYFMALHESVGGDCFSRLGEETGKMYAPGCSSMRISVHQLSSGQCATDEQSVANIGNLVVHSSDRVLGRVDIFVNSSGLEGPSPMLASVIQQDADSWKKLSLSSQIGPASLAQAFRYDRMSQKLFDGEEGGGASLVLGFDHQLVMSGKLAHLVPKDGQAPRSLQLGDLVFLLLFAILPEKKHIKHLIHRTRQFRFFKRA